MNLINNRFTPVANVSLVYKLSSIPCYAMVFMFQEDRLPYFSIIINFFSFKFPLGFLVPRGSSTKIFYYCC